jgi:hypothetical protein
MAVRGRLSSDRGNAGSCPISSSPGRQRALGIAERVFEENMAGHANDAEESRLREIWGMENHRLHDEVEAGRLSLTIAERNKLIDAMPEYSETVRLYDLKWSHLSKMDELIRQMWAIPALTPEGRAAKVWVLLACVMDPEEGWSDYDGHYRIDESVEQARALLIELVGGEPGQALREPFA